MEEREVAFRTELPNLGRTVTVSNLLNSLLKYQFAMHRYRLNESHSFSPRTPQNIAALNRVTEYLAHGKTASEDELRSVLSGLTNPHGCIVKWLARKSRKVLLPVTGAGVIPEPPKAAPSKQRKSRSRSSRTADLELWTNPNDVDLDQPLIYRIEIHSGDGEFYDYIGKARNSSRLREYERNMKKIREGRERGRVQNYRAVHFALFQAIEQNWRFRCFPLENCLQEKLNLRERQLIREFPCNLNDARGWRVADLASLSVESLLCM